MGIRVCKFGGSSVADADQLRKVRAIVEARADRRFVVPSAPGKRFSADEKVTDLLYRADAATRKSDPKGLSFDQIFDLICERYRKILADLGLSYDLGPALAEVHARILAGAGPDYAASRGEYLCGLIVARLLDRPFVDPADMILFDTNGRFLSEETQARVADRLTREREGVVPGFYGALPDGSIKTFSRGGSDMTGSIVARGVAAELYENWTDVSGLLMTDPRIVPHAKPMEEVTYAEIRELSYMGASVLHDEAMAPVREAGIPVSIRNTNDPADRGTRFPAPVGR